MNRCRTQLLDGATGTVPKIQSLNLKKMNFLCIHVLINVVHVHVVNVIHEIFTSDCFKISSQN